MQQQPFQQQQQPMQAQPMQPQPMQPQGGGMTGASGGSATGGGAFAPGMQPQMQGMPGAMTSGAPGTMPGGAAPVSAAAPPSGAVPSNPLTSLAAVFSSLATAPTAGNLIQCANATLPMLDAIFGAGSRVARLLESDVAGHRDEVASGGGSAAPDAPILGLVDNELATNGGAAPGSGVCHGTALLVRTFRFVQRFLELLAGGGAGPASARTAYGEVLAPHHNLAVAGIVKIALGAVPSVDGLISAFGLPSAAEATAELQAAQGAMAAALGPLAAALTQRGMQP